MSTSTITRRAALTGTVAGAIVLVTGIGTAAAAVRRPARKWPSGAWYVREYEKIGISTSCCVGPDGKPRSISHSLDEYRPGLFRLGKSDAQRFGELSDMMLDDDPRGRQKVMRHCIKSGRAWQLRFLS